MSSNEEAASRGQTQSGGRRRMTGSPPVRHMHSRASDHNCKAPSGNMPAYLGGDGLVYVNGRHLCSIRGGDLCRTFDPQRELMRGCLAFRLDIVNLAIKTGAMRIVAKERGTGNRWAIDMVTFIGKGDLYRHHLYGEQWRCSLKHWSLNGQTPEAQLEPVQPTLFEVAA